MADTKVKGKKIKLQSDEGVCHISASFNNTKVSFTNLKGDVISWSSSGKCGFRGSRKSTSYAAQTVVLDAGNTAVSYGLKTVSILVSGPGTGRESAIRAVHSLNITISKLKDVTKLAHGGCRKKKQRRV